MEVILLEKVTNLGMLGDKVSVKSGYGRNFLVPYGKAVRATKGNVEAFEVRREELERKAQNALGDARRRADAIDKVQIVMKAKAGEEGKLFGSIGAKDLADEITERAGVKVWKKEMRLPEGALRTIGEHAVSIHLHSDIVISITVSVEAEIS